LRRVTLQMEPDGHEVTWKCKVASYGLDSINLIMRNAEEPPPNRRKHELLVIPFRTIQRLTEEEW
jgi:hypothetical protein